MRLVGVALDEVEGYEEVSEDCNGKTGGAIGSKL